MELTPRKATEADYPEIQRCLDSEWPGEEPEDLGKLNTIILEGIGFISFFVGKYLHPTVRHYYVYPDKRHNGASVAFPLWFARHLRKLGYDKLVVICPKSRTYIERFLLRNSPAELFAEDELNNYYIVSTEVGHAIRRG